MTNRELAQRLNVDPGHLHFHVRMLNRAGLIERAEAAGREKPYRPVAKHLRVGPEIRATGLASDLQGAQLRELQRGFDLHAANGEFRSAQVHAKVDIETLRKLFRELLDTINEVEDESAAAADDHVRVSPRVRAGRRGLAPGRRRQHRRFGQRAREASARRQPFQDERRVGNRYVLEVVGPRLERAHDRLDRLDECHGVVAGDECQRIRDVGGKFGAGLQRLGQVPRIRPPGEHEERERRRIAPDRRFGRLGTEAERPLRIDRRRPPRPARATTP